MTRPILPVLPEHDRDGYFRADHLRCLIAGGVLIADELSSDLTTGSRHSPKMEILSALLTEMERRALELVEIIAEADCSGRPGYAGQAQHMEAALTQPAPNGRTEHAGRRTEAPAPG